MKLNIKTKLAGFAVVLAFLAPSLTFAQETKTYTVKPGDTLSEIAETYNTTVEKLAKLNNIKNVDLIFIDQVLVIDGTAPVAETTTTEAPVAEVEETPTVAETVVEETTYEETYEAPAQAPAATESYSAPAATVSGSEAEAKEWIAQKESGGSYTATNGRYGSWTAAKKFWLNNGWY